jgi:hypothetical protein
MRFDASQRRTLANVGRWRSARAVIATIGVALAWVGVVTCPALAASVGDQDQPALAPAADGGFLVVWRRFPGGVRAQRYDATGVPVGPERRVSPDVSSDQYPTVSRLRDGGFLVVWKRYGTGVVGRRLDAAGVPVGGEIAIAASFAFGGLDLAIHDNGRGLVTWTEDDGDSAGIFARRLRPNGTPRDPSFRVNAHTAGSQFHPRVASVRPLRFVVVWSDHGARDGSDDGVVAQRINRLGNPIGTEFVVNSYTTGDQRYPDVARGQGRDFVVVWEGGTPYGEIGPDGYTGFGARGIRGQRFGPRARKLGEETEVSTFEYGPHLAPSVDVTEHGFVVAWAQGAQYSYDYGGRGPGCGDPLDVDSPQYRCQDGVGLGVVTQRLDSEGGKVGGEQVLTGGFQRIDQYQGVVAALPPGHFVVAWTDAGCLRAESYNCRYLHNRSGIATRVIETAPR